MPRDVFQELFIRRSDHLGSLSESTMSYLRGQRSARTLSDVDVLDLKEPEDRATATAGTLLSLHGATAS
jgi:hypothetical protein